MPDTTVKFFDSTMSGAPALSGEAGKLIDVLDACLVNGFGSVTLDSLVIASNIATGTISTGHNFAMVGDAGPVIKIEGATPSGLNGEWRLASVPTANTFTFATSGIADQTATGTITAKRAPSGFEKAFSGTNKAAYRSLDIQGTQLYLRVDDSPAQYPTLIMYETMSDVDTGTGPSPTTGSLWFGKSTAASSTAIPWRLFSDNRCFYLLADNIAGTPHSWYGAMSFGDILSYKTTDPYACLLKAHVSQGYQFEYVNMGLNGGFLSRSHTGIGAAIASIAYSNGRSTRMGGNSQAYPAPVDNGFHAWPVEVWETAAATLTRGIMPGLWNPIHSGITENELVITDIPQLSGRTLFYSKQYSTYGMAFDITGPWR